MGMAGSFFEPQPWNFGILVSFRDVQMILVPLFEIPYWNVHTSKKCSEASCPGDSKIHGLNYTLRPMDTLRWMEPPK